MLQLSENNLDKGHTINMEQFYSSSILFDLLWSKKTLAVRTFMKNKKELPVTIKSTTLKKCGWTMQRTFTCYKNGKRLICSFSPLFHQGQYAFDTGNHSRLWQPHCLFEKARGVECHLSKQLIELVHIIFVFWLINGNGIVFLFNNLNFYIG